MTNTEDGLINMETTIILMLSRVILPLRVRKTDFHSHRPLSTLNNTMNIKNSLDLRLELNIQIKMKTLNNKLQF